MWDISENKEARLSFIANSLFFSPLSQAKWRPQAEYICLKIHKEIYAPGIINAKEFHPTYTFLARRSPILPPSIEGIAGYLRAGKMPIGLKFISLFLGDMRPPEIIIPPEWRHAASAGRIWLRPWRASAPEIIPAARWRGLLIRWFPGMSGDYFGAASQMRAVIFVSRSSSAPSKMSAASRAPSPPMQNVIQKVAL